MKKILFISVIIASLIILVLSRAAYQEKLNNLSSNATSPSGVEIPENEEAKTPEAPTQETNRNIKGIIGSWFDDNPDKEAIHLTYFGSVSLVNQEDKSTSWPNLVSDSLSEQLASIEVNDSLIEVGRLTTDVVIEEGYVDEVIATTPDIILFEPFILNNNGNIFIEDSLEMTELIMSSFEQSLPDTTIILMPPNPLYGTIFYQEQVSTLKTFADENDYLFANHWEAWPPTDNENLEDHLTDGRPNTEGHEIWASYMIDYLITD
ncbi:hypothetical protein AB3N04_13245 [Alkalihalophilus sp. As8PL]|uniref:SGNH/GDSL hydrolase family protein n=1 Tax=Alkalihalophilus sp. As8PL TaxID=3237103 RepID=A0AB39BPM5_9BACI